MAKNVSGKSIALSILSILLFIGLLFAVVFLFAINFVLGIVGIVIWAVVPSIVRNKALDNAEGTVDTILAKYIAPIVATFGAVAAILYILGVQFDLF